jgi:amidohydrolase
LVHLNVINGVINKILPGVLDIRKKIHQNPELGYEEYQTTELIIKKLTELGLNVETKYSKTGAVGHIHVPGATKTIAVRADIDALPISENTGLPFASEKDGVMHACGHDVHTSIALGVAELLSILKDTLKVNVKFIFQPAEECSPRGGARTMIENGVLDGVDAILGLHVWPSLPVGTIGVVNGSAMAASDRLRITIEGKSGHAAEPQNSVDAIYIAAQVINTINSFKAKNIDPFEPVVISLGSIHSEGRYNIVCPKVDIEGTIRTLNESTRMFINENLRQLIASTVKAFGGNCDIDIISGYDVLINDEKLTDDFIKITRAMLGAKRVLSNIRPSMIAEDFSFYAKQVPGTYFFLGCTCQYPLHSNLFVPDERCTKVGIKVIANFILNYFK